MDWLINDANCDGSTPLSTERPRALRIDRPMMQHVDGAEDDDNDDTEDDAVVEGDGCESDWLDSKMASAERTIVIEFRPISISEKRCTQKRHAAQNSSKTRPRDCSVLLSSSVRELMMPRKAVVVDRGEYTGGSAADDDEGNDGAVSFESMSIPQSQSLLSSSEANKQPENSNTHTAFPVDNDRRTRSQSADTRSWTRHRAARRSSASTMMLR